MKSFVAFLTIIKINFIFSLDFIGSGFIDFVVMVLGGDEITANKCN